MNKNLIVMAATIFSAIGSYVPVLLGGNLFGGWSIVWGMVSGLFGIWITVAVMRRWG